ncbi:MAG: 3-keto-disaccharide hydrolase [Candidatus Cyclobacteriaceae bacterium M3_2C_046]
MKRSILALLIGLCFACSNPEQDGFETLFEGENLQAWQTPDLAEAWTVNDGLLVVQSDEAKTGSILWTKNDYQDFIIKADFKFGQGTVDSGIFLRDESQQIQIGESGSLKRDMTCSPYIPGKGYPVEATGVADIIKMDDWNTIQVQAQGNQYTAWLNGEEVMNYTSDNAVETGPIGIQLHPNRDMTMYYKNIEVKEL